MSSEIWRESLLARTNSRYGVRRPRAASFLIEPLYRMNHAPTQLCRYYPDNYSFFPRLFSRIQLYWFAQLSFLSFNRKTCKGRLRVVHRSWESVVSVNTVWRWVPGIHLPTISASYRYSRSCVTHAHKMRSWSRFARSIIFLFFFLHTRFCFPSLWTYRYCIVCSVSYGSWWCTQRQLTPGGFQNTLVKAGSFNDNGFAPFLTPDDSSCLAKTRRRYMSNVHCEFEFHAPTGNYIYLEFVHFRLDFDCDSDFVLLEATGSVPPGQIPERRHFCGRLPKRSGSVIASDRVRLTFKSDGNYSCRGFSGFFHAHNPLPVTGSGELCTLHVCRKENIWSLHLPAHSHNVEAFDLQ